jgi:hypothetical protein
MEIRVLIKALNNGIIFLSVKRKVVKPLSSI